MIRSGNLHYLCSMSFTSWKCHCNSLETNRTSKQQLIWSCFPQQLHIYFFVKPISNTPTPCLTLLLVLTKKSCQPNFLLSKLSWCTYLLGSSRKVESLISSYDIHILILTSWACSLNYLCNFCLQNWSDNG